MNFIVLTLIIPFVVAKLQQQQQQQQSQNNENIDRFEFESKPEFVSISDDCELKKFAWQFSQVYHRCIV
jgi:hypothetical protein